LTRNFASVVDKNDILWDVNNASIKISANTNLTLNGSNNLTLSDGTNTTTLNALLLRIKALEDKNVLQDAEIAVAKTLPAIEA
jgi:hypothetical protein